MSCKKADIAELDKWFRPCGPCIFCGHRDKRHRLWDVWIDSHEGKAKWTLEQIDTNWPGYGKEAIEAVLRVRPYHREKRK